MVDRDRKGFARTLEITRKYFAPGKPLSMELQLFRTIRNTRGASEQFARRVLGEVARRASKTDERMLEIKKSNLIKDVHHSFGREFFSTHRIPEYRLLATVQLYLDGVRGKKSLDESVRALQLEDVLVKYMTSDVPVAVPPAGIDEHVDRLVCVMAARRFGEKYGDALGKGQKLLLQSYVKSLVTEDAGPVTERLSEDRKRITGVLEEHRDEEAVRSDDVTRERYVEALGRLGQMDVDSPTDEIVEEMMLFHRLADELESK